MRHLIISCCVITCLNSVSAIAQTYYADTVAGPMTDRPSRILQTNSAGTDVFVFDPDTMEQVGYIPNLPHNHGATVHADGTLLLYQRTRANRRCRQYPNLEVEHAFNWPTALIIFPQACEPEKSTLPLLRNR